MFHAPHLPGEASGVVLNCLARFKASGSSNISNVVARIAERIHDSRFQGYSGKDVAIVLNALVRLRRFDKAIFESAASHLQRLPTAEFISEKHLGLILNAYARAGIVDVSLFASLFPRIDAQLEQMGSQSCGNICHALGKLSIVNESTRRLVSKLSLRILKHKAATNQEISNVFHSVAKLEIADADIVEPLLRIVSRKMHTFNSVEVAAVATALAKLNISDNDLMRKIYKRVSATEQQFNAYELTAVLHASSRLDSSVSRDLFENFDHNKLQGSNSHTGCIALCAYARVGIKPSDVLVTTMSDLIKTESNGQYLVDVLFGLSRFASLSENLEELLYAVARKLLACDYPRTAANINQLIYSLMKLKSTCTADSVLLELFNQALVQGAACVESFEERHIANILFSISSSPEISGNEAQLAKLLGHKILGIKNPQLFSSCVESVAKLGLTSASLWNQIERKIKVTIPDSATIDVRTSQALAHVGRFQGDVAQMLLQRISVDTLSVSSSIALLYTLAFARVKNGMTCDALITSLVNRVPIMNEDQFYHIAALLVNFDINRFPFSLVKANAADLSESPMIMMHSSRDERQNSESVVSEISKIILSSSQNDRAAWMSYIESCLRYTTQQRRPGRLSADLENVIASFVPQMDLAELVRIIPYIPVNSTYLVAQRCLEVLRIESDKCSLEGVSTLKTLNSPEINSLIKQDVIPKLVSSASATDVIDFINRSLEA